MSVPQPDNSIDVLKNRAQEVGVSVFCKLFTISVPQLKIIKTLIYSFSNIS